MKIWNKTGSDLYVTTEVGQFMFGGVALWVDRFIKYVVPKLERRPTLMIEIGESHIGNIYYAQAVEPLLRLNLPIVWMYPNKRDKFKKMVDEADNVHLLTTPYGLEDHDRVKDLYKDAKSMVIHSVQSETNDNSMSKPMYQYRERLIGEEFVKVNITENYKKNEQLQDYFLENVPNKIWVGIEKKMGLNIPNIYEFHNTHDNNGSNIVGYASRIEARKNIHYLDKIQSVAFTSWTEFQNLKRKAFVDRLEKDGEAEHILQKTQVLGFSSGQVEDFYKSDDWGISHCCFDDEPFGYTIMQSIDYGKIPILHTDWNSDLDYPYRASNKEEFDKCVKKIKLLGVGKRNHYLSILKDYCVEKYGDIDSWSNKLASFYNEF